MRKKTIVLENMKDRKRYDEKIQKPIGRLSELLRKESEHWLENGNYELYDDLLKWSSQLTKFIDDAAYKYLNP